MPRQSCRKIENLEEPEGKTVFLVRIKGESIPLVLYCQRVGLKYNTVLSRIFRSGVKSKAGVLELKPNQNPLHRELLSLEMKPRGRKALGAT